MYFRLYIKLNGFEKRFCVNFAREWNLLFQPVQNSCSMKLSVFTKHDKETNSCSEPLIHWVENLMKLKRKPSSVVYYVGII